MKKGKILLAEHINMAARDIILMLHTRGHKIDRAVDAKTVLEMYQAEHYDFILMSTWLPGISSLEITRTIRTQEEMNNGKFTPIIGIFSVCLNDKKQSFQKYFRAGMNDIFPQPLTPETIDKILEKYLF